jgi:hypothetical protein
VKRSAGSSTNSPPLPSQVLYTYMLSTNWLAFPPHTPLSPYPRRIYTDLFSIFVSPLV